MDLDTLYKEEQKLLKKLVESDGQEYFEYQEVPKKANRKNKRKHPIS